VGTLGMASSQSLRLARTARVVSGIHPMHQRTHFIVTSAAAIGMVKKRSRKPAQLVTADTGLYLTNLKDSTPAVFATIYG